MVVLGQKSAALLFPGRPALGESVLLNGTSFLIVGVAEKTGRGNDDGTNQQIYIPLTTMLEMFPIKGENLPQDALSSIQYQPRVRGESESAKAAARAIIASRHGFSPIILTPLKSGTRSRATSWWGRSLPRWIFFWVEWVS